MRAFLLCIGALILFPAIGHTEVIGTIEFSGTVGVGPAIRDTVFFRFGRDSRPVPIGPGTLIAPIIFDGLPLQPTDVGSTFTITQSDDPDFDSLVAILTNGENDRLGIQISLGAPTGGVGTTLRTEAGFFFGDDSGTSGIDFQGFDIDSIALHLNQLDITHPPPPITTRVVFDTTLIVTGQPVVVPEPSTVALVALGSFGLIGYAWRRGSGGKRAAH